MSPQYIVDMILANANKRIFTQNWMLYQKIRVPSPPPLGAAEPFLATRLSDPILSTYCDTPHHSV